MTNYAAIHWVDQHGYKWVSFLSSSAHLRNELFQHRRRWGTTKSIPSCMHRLIWLKVQHVTPAVSRIFNENPFVIVDVTRKLNGQIIVGDPGNVPDATVKEWIRNYATQVSSSLIIRSVHSFGEGSVQDNDFELVTPLGPSSEKLRG